jgi:hypothetical protein
LTQAARLLPPGRHGRPVSLSCIIRWVLTGATGPSGERVRVEALRLGGRWLTSREALQRFAERLTPRPDGKVQPASRGPGNRRRDSERAAAELEQLGV